MIARRRFLTITAAAAAAGSAALGARAAAPPARWRGVALGAGASLEIHHPDGSAMIRAALAELARLEAIFSLYRADSALSRLNAAGALDAPPPELVSLLSFSRAVHRATSGAFDPSVQPLWRTHAAAAAEGRAATPDEIAAARALVGFDKVEIDAARISFTRPGVALTLNGVAQGWIADRVADLLRARGLRDALIDMGEIVTLGARADGAPWRVGLSRRGAAPRQVEPSGVTAVASSAARGTVLDPQGRVGHIFDPIGGRSEGVRGSVSVRAPRAAEADAFSTAFILMKEADIDQILAARPSLRVLQIEP